MVEFSVNQTEYQINFEDKNQSDKNNRIQSIVKAVNYGQISRDSYHDLAATDYHIECTYSVFNKWIEITNYINQIIKFSIIDMKEKYNLKNIKSEEPDITDIDIIKKITDTMGIFFKVQKIFYAILYLICKKKILNKSDPIIHLRISGDGWNVGRKIKHIMVTFMILNYKSKCHNADYHYTVALYPGIENYNTLKFILDPFFEKLRFLKNNELEISGTFWRFELYFSSDWKFLTICLGLNYANSKYFCLWCIYSKNQLGNLSKDWIIEKDMDEISKNYNNIQGHIASPLFNMVPINYIVFDKLHVFLRITDRL